MYQKYLIFLYQISEFSLLSCSFVVYVKNLLCYLNLNLIYRSWNQCLVFLTQYYLCHKNHPILHSQTDMHERQLKTPPFKFQHRRKKTVLKTEVLPSVEILHRINLNQTYKYKPELNKCNTVASCRSYVVVMIPYFSTK